MCIQRLVKCEKCGREFYRYDYGKGKRRMRRWGKGRGKGSPYAPESHAKLTDSCILCRGTVRIV